MQSQMFEIMTSRDHGTVPRFHSFSSTLYRCTIKLEKVHALEHWSFSRNHPLLTVSHFNDLVQWLFLVDELPSVIWCFCIEQLLPFVTNSRFEKTTDLKVAKMKYDHLWKFAQKSKKWKDLKFKREARHNCSGSSMTSTCLFDIMPKEFCIYFYWKHNFSGEKYLKHFKKTEQFAA